MALDFVEWILNKKASQIGENKNNAKSVTIDAGAKVGKVKVFQSEPNLLKQVVTVDNVTVFPIDSKVDSNLTSWRQNEPLRRDVCHKLVTYLTESSKQTADWKEPRELNKVKASLRLSAVKNLLSNQSTVEPVEYFLPGAKYSLIVSSTYPSLLALSNQLVPYLLSGIALTVLSNAQTSIHVSYLIDLLIGFGVPSSGVINQLINFEVTNEGQIASFVLLDDADIDSALDSALTSQMVYGIPCVKIFAQDSLKSTVQQILNHKLQIQAPEGDLFFENELFNQSSVDAKVNHEAINFETNQSGLDVYFYRTTGEVLKMVNHLQGSLRQRLVSIWSEKTGLGLKVAQAVQSCKQVLINTGIPTVGYNSFGWQFELIASSALSRLAADNAELPLKLAQLNKSWSSSVITRVRTVHSLLDNLKLTNTAAIKIALHKTMKEVEDETSVNKMFINYYEPIGQVIVQLNDSETIDDTCLLSFGLNALVYGNSLILVGNSSSKQLAIWKKIQDFVDKQGFTNVVQTVQSGKGVKVESTSQGALQLVGEDGRTVQAVFIDQEQFQQEYFSRLLRRVRRSIAISLAEFDLSKIVE